MLNIVITGVFNGNAMGHHGRDELKRIIRAAGHKVCSEVTGRTDYLVVGDSPGPSKMERAAALGTRQITDAQLRRIVAA